MCDTIVAVHPGRPVWLAKNSDREPGEEQVVEVARADATHEAILSRPAWMWGCEMGVNIHGLAVGNEAVFTRLPVAREGASGMDFQRQALESAATAEDALELIVELLARQPQGGRMSHRKRLRYHSSFVLADPNGAWVLETAGELWAAQRVRGVRTISNVLTIGRRFDRVHDRAYDVARDRGWCRNARDFSFRRAFSRPVYRALTGGEVRRAATRDAVESAGEDLDATALATVLRSHRGRSPAAGWRMEMPCAHASWLPTRSAGQTTGSMIARLGDDGEGVRVWMTGTSSPCLSVFKPVAFGGDFTSAGAPGEDSLWRLHERLHRTTLADYARRRAAFETERAALEARALAAPHDLSACTELWQAHRDTLPRWARLAAAAGRERWRSFELYWRLQREPGAADGVE